MRKRGEHIPPRWALAFFRWFCKPERAEDLEGDMLERFNRSLSASGIAAAKRRLILDVFSLLRPGIINTHVFNIRKTDALQLCAMNFLLVLLIVFPFLPGPPSGLILVLSVLGQIMGVVGLVFLPVAITWTILEVRRQVKIRTTNVYAGFSYGYSIFMLILCTLVFGLVVVALFPTAGPWAGTTAVAVGVFFFILALRGINRTRKCPGRKFNMAPLYFLTLPLMAFLARSFVLGPVSGFSRNLAIERSQPLITAIEEYKMQKGVYPETLAALKKEKNVPEPFIMGISQYRYNRINGQYSLSFSQWLDFGSLEEIVVYDKTDLANNLTGRYASYDYKFDLCRIKYSFARGETGHSNWKYYHCD